MQNKNDPSNVNILDLIYTARSSALPQPLDSAENTFSASAQEAFSRIVDMYNNMLTSIIARYSGAGPEWDDLRQEALIGLYKAVMLYDPTYSSFSTFAFLCMKRSVISCLRSYLKTRPELRVSLGDLYDDTENESSDDELYSTFVYPDNLGDPEKLYIDKETTELMFEKIDKLLTPLENSVLRCWLKSKSYDSIAAELGITNKSVENALMRVRKKLRGILD